MLSTIPLGVAVILMLASSFMSIYWFDDVRRYLRERRKPANFRISMFDADNIPIRDEMVSAEGIARLIRDINSGYYK